MIINRLVNRIKKFNSYTSVDADELWENIEKELPKEKKRRFLFHFRWPILAILPLIVAGLGLWHHSNISSSTTGHSVEENDTNSIYAMDISDKVEPVTHTSIEPTKMVSKNTSSVSQREIQSALQTVHGESVSMAHLDTDRVIEQGLIEYKKKNPNIKAGQIMKESLTPGIRIADLPGIGIIHMNAFLQNRKLPDPNIEFIEQEGDSSVDNKSASGLCLEVNAGTSMWRQSLDHNMELTDYHTTQLGFTVGANVEFPILDWLHGNVGLNYVMNSSQFNYNYSWDTLVLEDNGQEIVTLNGRATRTIRHNNRLKFLSAPLLLGVKSDKGRNSIGINFGVGVNYVLSQHGRSLSISNELYEYENDLVPSNALETWYLSYHVQPFYRFSIGEETHMGISMDLAHQRLGYYQPYNANVNIMQYQFKIGFRKYF